MATEDILASWGVRPPPGALRFAIQPRLDLGNVAQVDWLRETCQREGVTLLVLDTWTALSPAADPLAARDQAQLAATVVELGEALEGLVIVVDHSRKNRPEGQVLSAADIHGPYVKWAAAEHIVMQDRVTGCPHRFEVSVEGKDIEADRFFFDVSPRGSGAEKFTCAGTAAELFAGRAARGDQNRQAVLEVLAGGARPLNIEEVLQGLRQRGVRLGRATIRRHLTALVQAGVALRTGSGTSTSYRVHSPSEPAAHLTPTERADGGLR